MNCKSNQMFNTWKALVEANEAKIIILAAAATANEEQKIGTKWHTEICSMASCLNEQKSWGTKNKKKP